MNRKQMRTVVIAGTIGVAHAAFLVGAVLVQGCGTTRGPAGLSETAPMPPRAVPQTQKRLDPITPRPVVIEHVERAPAPVPPPPVADPVAPGATYTVAKGDTLSAIASRFGTTVAALMTVNNISDPDRIMLGQKLVLPADAGPAAAPRPAPVRPVVTGGAGTYTVQPGDSLSVIAWRSGVKVADLKRVNNLTSDLIMVDQKLVIPSGGRVPAGEQAQAQPDRRETAPVVAPPQSDRDALPDMVLPPVPGPALQDRPPTTTVREPRATSRYVVQPGDSLLSVASQWNVSILDLKRVNDVPDGPLTPGQELRIPVAD